ncbi:MAG: hypothetical protein JXX14_14985, partial [Deltaproteobacteria bacterium]|nr:hypothetical protein [Deltaproteobacteria bacterium]
MTSRKNFSGFVSMIGALVVMGILVGCSDGGGGGNDAADTTSSSDSASDGFTDSSEVGDSASGDLDDTSAGNSDSGSVDSSTNIGASTDSDTSSARALLRLSGLPKFDVTLPASFSHSTQRKKALRPSQLDEVQSEGYFQMQPERLFTVEIYAMRGLLTYLETFTQTNGVPENEVVELGIHTGIYYEGGPSDGQPMNPHLDMLNTDASYEGIDLGKLRWWKEGDVTHIAWHITDSSFADFPYWLIDIEPAGDDTGKNRYRIAAYREQWDGTQSTFAVRYLEYDDASGETVLFQRDAGFTISTNEGGISYRYIALKPGMDVTFEMDLDTEIPGADTESDTAAGADTETESAATDDSDTEAADTAGDSGDTETVDGADTVGDTDDTLTDSGTSQISGADSDSGGNGQVATGQMHDATVIYLESGEFNPVDMAQHISSQIAAVGNDDGGGLVAFTVPYQMWEDNGTEVIYNYFYREIYNGAGNLMTRAYARKFDDYCELTDFSGFLADTEAYNLFGASPAMAPAVVYRQYVFDFATSVSSYAVSLDAPSTGSWTMLDASEPNGRFIWKQNTEDGTPWTTGDVVYNQNMDEDSDCSVTGETACTIAVFRPYAEYPEATTIFGKTFYAENQWPIRYLSAADSLSTIKVNVLEDWPYLQTWIESDDNDVWDAGEEQLPASGFDVYFYTGDGELVESTMPMVYRAADMPPDSLGYDADASGIARLANGALNDVLAEMVPNIQVPHQIELLTSDAFLAQFEPVVTDTDEDTAGAPIDTAGAPIDTAGAPIDTAGA